MVDKKTFWIGILTVVAAVLVAAHALQPTAFLSTAHAGEAVDNRDFSMVAAESAQGGELVYILDKRSGLLALLNWNNQARKPEVIDLKPVQGVFGP